ncbi:alpha/beta hydrolase [Winogradskyella psychrotolerans]|uniref:alpha/beta hydrolase n=1 Tax=Winogradskyella psychrotolerans TaxID=1344585 RepID=UPI001C06F682|nr:alpha/beta hydrolase [Winogradskyella psychrotolerans]MBU2929974.1 alpha/beta hydrolase [Winogradskyella psychrotolerans]
MKRLLSIYLSLLFICLIASCDSERSEDTDLESLNPITSHEEFNISYGNHSDQVFDLYLPANRTMDTKTIVLLHGGGWTSGDKADMSDIKNFIKDQMPSYAIVNINYRLADENNPPYPMQINDITSVINFLDSNQSYYTISENLGFVGLSAGAHLALLWSYAFDTAHNVDMVASIVGPTNFTDPAYLNNTNLVLQQILDSYGINTSTDSLEEVSPYHKATSSAPPTILFYGGEDPLIPITQGTAMRDKLEELNITHQYTLYPNEGHGWTGLNLLDTTIQLKAFIETHL